MKEANSADGFRVDGDDGFHREFLLHHHSPCRSLFRAFCIQYPIPIHFLAVFIRLTIVRGASSKEKKISRETLA